MAPSKRSASSKPPVKEAIILAGGKGTRLKPYTAVFPKPLVPLGDMPVLEVVLRQLKYYGFERVTLAVGHLAELIQAYFGNGQKLGIELRYVFEEQPLGTAGPLALIEDLPEHVLVMNGDLVTDLNFALLLEAHQKAHAETGTLATMAVYQRTTQIDFGVIDFDPENGHVKGFREKPTLKHPVSMGINVFSREVLPYIPAGQFFGLDHLMAALLSAGETIEAYPFEGYWLDIGRHGDYHNAMADFELMQDRLLPKGSWSEACNPAKPVILEAKNPLKLVKPQAKSTVKKA